MVGKTKPTRKADRERFDKLKAMPCIACEILKMDIPCGPTEVHHLLSGNRRRGHQFDEATPDLPINAQDAQGARRAGMTVAALFVETGGCYFGLPGIDPWDEKRDARNYAGPYPVVAHPPCQRWGRFWHGSTRKPHQFKLGDDGGCFAAALEAVRRWGGVLEHPADRDHFGLRKPGRSLGWHIRNPGCNLGRGAQSRCFDLEFTCYVEQGHYGHISRKPTWLFACGIDPPELKWERLPQRLHPLALERYGYEKARRIGVMAMVGGKRKTEIRNATTPEFRDVLLGMARSVAKQRAA